MVDTTCEVMPGVNVGSSELRFLKDVINHCYSRLQEEQVEDVDDINVEDSIQLLSDLIVKAESEEVFIAAQAGIEKIMTVDVVGEAYVAG